MEDKTPEEVEAECEAASQWLTQQGYSTEKQSLSTRQICVLILAVVALIASVACLIWRVG